MDRLRKTMFAARAALLARPETLARLDPPPSGPPMNALPPNAAESIRLAEAARAAGLPPLVTEPAMDAGQPPSPPPGRQPLVIADRIDLLGPTPGPTPDPWPPDLPKLTEVQRLYLNPGDALVVNLDQRLVSMDEANRVERLVRAKLGLPPSTRILVIGGQDSISTLAGGD